MESQAEPRISIVVPVRNAERTIDTTMEYLLAVDYPRAQMEIVLADGGSKDGTIEAIRRWQGKQEHIRLVEIPNCGSPGHARNEALRSVTGDFILFTDGDCAPNPDWVRQLLRPFFIDAKIGGVGGEVLTLRTDMDNDTESYCEQTGFLSVSGRCGLFESGYFPKVEERAPHEVSGGMESPFFATANVAFRKDAIDAVGGGFWDEPTGEDVDFSLRVQQHGYRLYFAKEAVVRHMHRVSLESFLKQWHGYGFGHPLLLEKHAEGVLEVVLQFGRPIFLKVPSPRKGIVHVGTFHLLHVFGLTTVATGIAALLTGGVAPFIANGALLAITAASYFGPCLRLRPVNKILEWCKIRYLSNLAFVRGALDGCRKFGGVCIEPSW